MQLPWQTKDAAPQDPAAQAAAQAAEGAGSTTPPTEGAAGQPAAQQPPAAPDPVVPPGPVTPPVATVPEVTEVADEVMVTVTVPKAFNLTGNDHVRYSYKAGVQEMRVDHAEHWYAKANGVVVYNPKAK